MGCCCFNTLRGAAFFVSSIQIYNGLECILKFIVFPMLFSTMHASKDQPDTPSFINFMPGIVYSILYFLLGCLIFRGIEQESERPIKWGAVCFAITEISFFILRQVFKVTPTPKVPHLQADEQPFEMNIYKTLYYFLFTIVGGLIYICVLFLYLQQLGKGRDEFTQMFARTPWSTPTPTTTTQPAQPPAEGQGQGQQANPSGQGQGQQGLDRQNINNNDLHRRPSKHKSPHHQIKDEQQQIMNNHQQHNVPNPRKPIRHHPLSPPPGQGQGQGPPQGVGPPPPMDPLSEQSPSSPMFPYFLMRSGSGKPPHPPPPRHILDEPPQMWGPPPPPRPPMPSMRIGDPFGSSPRLLSPSRLVNHHQQPPPPMHSHPHPLQQFPPPPIIPPFYDDGGDSRRESFQSVPLGSPYFRRESDQGMYQKIGGFDNYTLR